MEFVAIIKLPRSTALNLNKRTNDGLQIIGKHGFRELNYSTPLHGEIESRVFYAQDVNPEETYKIILGTKSHPDAQKTFTIPDDQEFQIVDFPAI